MPSQKAPPEYDLRTTDWAQKIGTTVEYHSVDYPKIWERAEVMEICRTRIRLRVFGTLQPRLTKPNRLRQPA